MHPWHVCDDENELLNVTPCLSVWGFVIFQARFMVNLLLKFRLWGLGLSTVCIGAALAFFLMGLARLKSHFDVGQPHGLFAGLMIIEIGLPVLLLILWKLRKTKMR